LKQQSSWKASDAAAPPATAAASAWRSHSWKPHGAGTLRIAAEKSSLFWGEKSRGNGPKLTSSLVEKQIFMNSVSILINSTKFYR
jgi:hypothetical protein